MPNIQDEANDNVLIEKMDATSVLAVCELEKLCFSSPWSLNMLKDELLNPSAIFYTAKIDGAVVGYCGMHTVVDEGHIMNVATAPDFRRKGIAGRLLGAVIEYATEKNLILITLEVRVSNKAAIELYLGYGFEVVGGRPRYYIEPNEDAVLMTRFFTKDKIQNEWIFPITL